MKALELYLRTPFGRIHRGNPDIVKLSTVIDRTPSAVSLKMANFAALDPTIHQKGMNGFSKSDAKIWSEFFEAPSSFLSKVPSLVPSYAEAPPLSDLFADQVREGVDVERNVKTRQNQGYFREILFASYEGRCALTDIAQPELLNASHIKPWALDKEARLNPRNGILLNALHDRAFDRGLITFEDDLTLIVSQKISLPEMSRPFFDGKALRAPERFAPDPAFLAHHRDFEFEKFLK